MITRRDFLSGIRGGVDQMNEKSHDETLAEERRDAIEKIRSNEVSEGKNTL